MCKPFLLVYSTEAQKSYNLTLESAQNGGEEVAGEAVDRLDDGGSGVGTAWSGSR